ncbi:hypothetical protein LSPH24S_05128 [Lysinibacillus sphaericus]
MSIFLGEERIYAIPVKVDSSGSLKTMCSFLFMLYILDVKKNFIFIVISVKLC